LLGIDANGCYRARVQAGSGAEERQIEAAEGTTEWRGGATNKRYHEDRVSVALCVAASHSGTSLQAEEKRYALNGNGTQGVRKPNRLHTKCRSRTTVRRRGGWKGV